MESEKVSDGYALFNLVLSKCDFSKCDSYMEAMRLMYANLMPSINGLIADNLTMKKYLKEIGYSEAAEIEAVVKKEANIYLVAKKELEKDKANLMTKAKLERGHKIR